MVAAGLANPAFIVYRRLTMNALKTMHLKTMPQSVLDEEQADEYAQWFRCLADGTRIRVLNFVANAEGPVTVGEIVAAIGKSQSTVSRHLQVLADDRFIFTEPDGIRTLVSVNTKCMSALPEAAAAIMASANGEDDMISGALWLLVELTALFFGVAFAIQLLQRRLGHERIRSWMGGSPLSSALKGIAIGFVTPFCTYSAIPMLIGLRRAGVPTAGYVAFLAAAPVLDPVLFGALTLIVGLQAAVIYSLVAFVSAITLAMVAQRVGIDHRLKIPVAEPVVASHSATAVPTGFLVSPGLPTSQPLVEAEPEPTTSCSTSGTGDLPWAGLRAESVDAARAAIAFTSFGKRTPAGWCLRWSTYRGHGLP